MSAGKPYSTTAQVINKPLSDLMTQAGWNVTETTGDVAKLINEGDAEIDSRIGALGYTLPFTGSANPPLIQVLSVLYARYACFRDLYAGGSPSGGQDAELKYKNEFEEKLQKLEDGWASLLDIDGNILPSNKFTVSVAQNFAKVSDNPSILVSTHMDHVDEGDGLLPSSGDDDLDRSRNNDI